MRRFLFVVCFVAGATLALWGGTAVACGGFFCQTDPVDQAAERIVFTVNDDNTITSLIEIAYEGSAADFSWILPLPSAIGEDDLAVPEDGPEVFDELHRLTDVQIIAPPQPPCVQLILLSQEDNRSMSVDEAAVEVFASGEVGPFGFDVIGAEDPDALLDWLLDNNYTVTPEMEPLISVYVDEQFAFLAMRLLDGETSESITPIEITYAGTKPMIPLRLTAVAAFDNMPIFTWTFAADQVVPENYGHFDIPIEDITFFSGGGNDYRSQIDTRANEFGGRAFITQYAGPASALDFTNDYLISRSDHYVTRLATVISPDEMTADPVFVEEPGRADVSNILDATQYSGLYDCERSGAFGDPIAEGTSVGDDGAQDDGAQDEAVQGSNSGSASAEAQRTGSTPGSGLDLDSDDSNTGRNVATVAGLGLALGLFAWLGIKGGTGSAGDRGA